MAGKKPKGYKYPTGKLHNMAMGMIGAPGEFSVDTEAIGDTGSGLSLEEDMAGAQMDVPEGVDPNVPMTRPVFTDERNWFQKNILNQQNTAAKLQQEYATKEALGSINQNYAVYLQKLADAAGMDRVNATGGWNLKNTALGNQGQLDVTKQQGVNTIEAARQAQINGMLTNAGAMSDPGTIQDFIRTVNPAAVNRAASSMGALAGVSASPVGQQAIANNFLDTQAASGVKNALDSSTAELNRSKAISELYPQVSPGAIQTRLTSTGSSVAMANPNVMEHYSEPKLGVGQDGKPKMFPRALIGRSSSGLPPDVAPKRSTATPPKKTGEETGEKPMAKDEPEDQSKKFQSARSNYIPPNSANRNPSALDSGSDTMPTLEAMIKANPAEASRVINIIRKIFSSGSGADALMRGIQ